MENNQSFEYTYSAQQRSEVEAIRKKYLPREEDKMERLRLLHSSASKKAKAASISIGTVGALILGTGMSLVMTDIGATIGITSALVPGIAVGVLGLGMALLTYPMYKGILNSRKKKYGAEILSLSDKIMSK